MAPLFPFLEKQLATILFLFSSAKEFLKEFLVPYSVASSSHESKSRCPRRRPPRHQAPGYAFGRREQAECVLAWATCVSPGSFSLAGSFAAPIAAAGAARGATPARQK